MNQPRLTIVSPSYNQSAFLEPAIHSVVSQGYADLEYIVLDGGSTDGSIEIIRRHQARISHWRSSPDGGQAEAIRSGFAMASGDILAWLNSDDLYMPGALRHVARIFMRNPRVELVFGGCAVIDGGGRLMWKNFGFRDSFASLRTAGMFTYQPACFWRRSAYEAVGGVDPGLRFCMDYDLLMRLAARGRTYWTPRILAAYRVHGEAKGSTGKALHAREMAEVIARYAGDPPDRPLRGHRARVRYLMSQAFQTSLDTVRDPGYVTLVLRKYWAKLMARLRRGRPIPEQVSRT